MIDRKTTVIEEGRNQALYLLLCIGDEQVAHDNWHPDKAQFLYEIRAEIVRRLPTTLFPKEYPNFKTYTYRPG